MGMAVSVQIAVECIEIFRNSKPGRVDKYSPKCSWEGNRSARPLRFFFGLMSRHTHKKPSGDLDRLHQREGCISKSGQQR